MGVSISNPIYTVSKSKESALRCVLGITPHPVHIIPCSCSSRILTKIAFLLYCNGRSVEDAILEAPKTCRHGNVGNMEGARRGPHKLV